MSLEGKREEVPSLGSLWDIFSISVLGRPNSEAVYDATTKTSLTFKELETRINFLNRHLKPFMNEDKHGQIANPDGDRVVALCMEPSANLIAAIFAILKSNAAYLPLDVTFPLSRVFHILEDSQPLLLITSGRPEVIEALEKEKKNAVKVLHLEDLPIDLTPSDENATENEESVHTVQDVAAVLYTSGSTGVPKGVRIPESAILNRLTWQWRRFPYRDNEVCCFKTALTFVDSVSEIFGPLLTGHKLVVIPKSMTIQVDVLLKVLAEHKVRRIVLVPTLLRTIMWQCSQSKGNSLQDLDLWICSGEVFPHDLLRAFFETFPSGKTICNFYGSTEVMGDVTFLEFSSFESTMEGQKNVPVGLPVSNCSIFLMDKKLKEVDSGMVGEIFVSGRNLAKGYVGVSTSEKFLDSPFKTGELLFRTGDFGRVKDGLLYFEGREDSQIKIRGHRIDINEVNSALQNVSLVENSCTICFHPGDVDQALLGFYVSPDERCTPSHVRSELKTLLPPYMLPQLIKMEDFPLLVNGKVDKQTLIKTMELRQKEEVNKSEIDLSNCPEGSEDKARAILQRIVAALGPTAPSRISLADNFFRIGGSSLNAIMAITSLQDVGYEVGISDFIRAQSFLELLSIMDQNLPESPTKSISLQNAQREESICQFSKIRQNYRFVKLHDSLREVGIRIMLKSFLDKSELEKALSVKEDEYYPMMGSVWNVAQSEISFLVFSKETDQVVGVCINSDLHTEKELELFTKKDRYIYTFLDECESKVRDRLQQGEKAVFHCIAMNTSEETTTSENVSLIIAMETENIRLANEHGFKTILTSNSSDLTMHVCEDLLGYDPLVSVQANLWEASDGTRPFQVAPDTCLVNVAVKFLNPMEK